MSTTADNLHLPTDVPGAFPRNTIYMYIYDLDSVHYNLQRLIDFRVKQAEARLDATLKAAERRERNDWLRWKLRHFKITGGYRSYLEVTDLYQQWLSDADGAVPSTSTHRDPPSFMPHDLGSEDWHYDATSN